MENKDKRVAVMSDSIAVRPTGTVAIDAPQNEISTLSGKIGRLPGVTVKTAYSNVGSDK